MAALRERETKPRTVKPDETRNAATRPVAATEQPAGEREGLQNALGNRGMGRTLDGGGVPAPVTAQTSWFLAEDSAGELSQGQMRRAEFLRMLQRVVYASTEEGLAPLGRTARDCPYLRAMFRFYGRRDAAALSQAVRSYAPETAWAASAAESARMIQLRVMDSVRVWASTGRLVNVPQWRDEPGSVVGAQIRSGLGEPLPGGVRGRMEGAFGEDFAGVRVHADGQAAEFAAEQKARAVTIGQDVYFGHNEFRPGTLAGDAILAHELAHVVQQRGGPSTDGEVTDRHGSRDYERDADRAAGAAVHSIWTRSLKATARVLKRASVSMRTGLSVQRCGSKSTTAPGSTGGVSDVTHTTSNYTPGGTGGLVIGDDPRPAPMPRMAMEIPDYTNGVTVATSGGTDTEATDYQAGYVQTVLSSSISFEYQVPPNIHAFSMEARALTSVRDGVDNTTAPWYDSPNSMKNFAKANSSMDLTMRDTPLQAIAWQITSQRSGRTAFLTSSTGKDEFCTWLAVRKVSTGAMTYLNWNTWSVDWAATFDAPAKTGSQSGQGSKFDPPSTGQGPNTPVEGGDLMKVERSKPGNGIRVVP